MLKTTTTTNKQTSICDAGPSLFWREHGFAKTTVKLTGRIIICLPCIAFISFNTIPSPGPILNILRKSDSGNRQMYTNGTKEMALKFLISKRNTSETAMKSPQSNCLGSRRRVSTIFGHVNSTLATDPAKFSVGLHYLLTLPTPLPPLPCSSFLAQKI